MGIQRAGKMTISGRGLLAAALLYVAIAGSASAQPTLLTSQPSVQENITSIEPFQDWQVTCDQTAGDQQTCSMAVSATVQAPDGNAVTVRVSRLPVRNRRDPLFAVETPLDLLLSKGIEMRVDGGPVMRLAFRSCHRDGCLAPFSLSNKIARQFRGGHSLGIRLFDLEGRAVDVPLSLLGFSAAEQSVAM